MTTDIRLRSGGAGAQCASILAELPEWFGIAQSNADYAARAEGGPAWVAEQDGDAVGVMVLESHGADAVEIHLLAVRRTAHRRGVGTRLVERARAEAASRGARYLTVKTRGPSRQYEPYERTRAFYRAVGFVALEEFDQIWGPENPCLFTVAPVS